MAGDARLSRQKHPIADAAAAGHADLAAEDAALADLRVVADLHQVVDLRSATDRGGVEGGPIHRRVGADLHVVPDHDDADLRQLDLGGGFRALREPETVRAQDDTGVHDHPLADAGAVVDHDVGMEHGAGAQTAAAAYHGVGADHHARTERRAPADHGECVDAGGVVDLGGSVDTGRFVNAGFHFGDRKESRHQVGQGPVGVVAEHQIAAEIGERFGRQVPGHQQRTGLRSERLVAVPGIGQKGEITGARGQQGGYAVDRPIRIALEVSSNHRGKIGEAVGHEASLPEARHAHRRSGYDAQRSVANVSFLRPGGPIR